MERQQLAEMNKVAYKTRCDKGKKRLYNNDPDSLLIARSKHYIPYFKEWADVFCHRRYGHWSFYISPSAMPAWIIFAEAEGVKVYDNGGGGYYSPAVPGRTFNAYRYLTAEGWKTLVNITALLVAMGYEPEDYDPEEPIRL